LIKAPALAALALFAGTGYALQGGALEGPDDRIETDAPLEPSVEGPQDLDGLSGAVTQRTVTHMGNEFYRQFASYWRSLGVQAQGVLVVEERPSAEDGTQVFVTYGRQRVFETTIGPRGPSMDELGREAARIVADTVAQLDQAGGNQQDPDLAEEEL